MPQILERPNQRLAIHSWADDADEQTLQQARNVANLPVAVGHVALMADAHVGFGMPIGGVVATEGAIIPYAVGMDIGCGMVAWKTGVPAAKLRPVLKQLAAQIRRDIPVGFAHRRPAEGTQMCERWTPELFDRLAEAGDRKKAYLSGQETILEQVGTLGSGNHFIEIQRDPEGTTWIMVHSGSRNVGKRICDHFHALAKKHTTGEPDQPAEPALSWLPADSEGGQDYIRHMRFAQDFAMANRTVMMHLCREALRRSDVAELIDEGGQEINIHHNYASREEHFGRQVWVHRKGATSAREGQLGIIPGSMGTASYIVRGKGNPDSLASCSHGAGRVMGRKQAKRTISMERFAETMKGIEFTPTPGHLDEAPDAYKDITHVMANQSDLVEIVTELRPMAVIKG